MFWKSDPDSDTNRRRIVTQVVRSDWTDCFMAPEVALAEEDANSRADSWSWGMMARYIIEGSPFGWSSLSEIETFREEAEEKVENLDAPSRLRNLIQYCLKFCPEDRPSPLIFAGKFGMETIRKIWRSWRVSKYRPFGIILTTNAKFKAGRLGTGNSKMDGNCNCGGALYSRDG